MPYLESKKPYQESKKGALSRNLIKSIKNIKNLSKNLKNGALSCLKKDLIKKNHIKNLKKVPYQGT